MLQGVCTHGYDGNRETCSSFSNLVWLDFTSIRCEVHIPQWKAKRRGLCGATPIFWS